MEIEAEGGDGKEKIKGDMQNVAQGPLQQL